MAQLYEGMEFAEGHEGGHWIVLKHENVVWDRALHGESGDEPCIGSSTGAKCHNPVEWIVLDYEGVLWPLCRIHGDSDGDFFHMEDWSLMEVDAAMPAGEKLTRWAMSPGAFMPIDPPVVEQ